MIHDLLMEIAQIFITIIAAIALHELLKWGFRD